MIKISIIFPSDPLGAKVGGAEMFINDVVKFAPPDFEIEFIGVTSDKRERPVKKWTKLKTGKKEFNFYPVYFEKEENRKGLIPLSLRFSLALSRSCPNFQGKVLFFNRIEPALFLNNIKVPKVGVIHNDICKQILRKNSEVLWSKFSWLYFKVEDLIFKSLDHVYSVSKSTVEFYRARYSGQKEKFSFLPTWADTDIFSPRPEPKKTLRQTAYFKEKNLPIDKNWILFVGRLQEQKAPIRLIDAFFEYYKENRDSCLIVAGAGNLMSAVESHIRKLGLKNNIFLLGQIARENLVNFYRAADSLLLTSNFEGMPLCVIEALRCGLPVVTTNVGEVKQVVRNGFSGEVIESFEPNDIAKGLGKVISNPSVYATENCLNCVISYTPEKVLTPVYEMIRALNRRYYK